MTKSFIYIGLITGALNALPGTEAQAQSISGPILGFIPDSGGAVIRPIMGVPGASLLGNPIEFDTHIHGAVISPTQAYAIAVRSEDGQVVVIDLRSGSLVVSPISGIHPGADVIATSPTGSAAAVYNHELRAVQVISHLPHAPQLIHEFDASRISGRATEVAVSDDGAIALVKFVDDDNAGLWAMDSSAGSWRISLDGPSAAAFLPNRRDAIVADDATHSAFIIMDVDHAATRIPLISAADGVGGFSSVSVSEDASRVFLADSDSGTVAIVDVETRQIILAFCQCLPKGLYRLKGTSIFRLTEAAREPVTVLDASSSELRILVIPPAAYE